MYPQANVKTGIQYGRKECTAQVRLGLAVSEDEARYGGRAHRSGNRKDRHCASPEDRDRHQVQQRHDLAGSHLDQLRRHCYSVEDCGRRCQSTYRIEPEQLQLQLQGRRH